MYIYIYVHIHPMTSIISRDFREIVASVRVAFLSLVFRHRSAFRLTILYLLFYWSERMEERRRAEMVCITKTLQSRNVAFIILTGGRVFSYESDFCGELCFDRRPPTLSDPQQ